MAAPEQGEGGGHDALAGVSVTVGVGGVGHGVVGLRVGQEGGNLGDDAVLVGAHELGDAEGDGLRPFGVLTHDEHGLGQGRGLFLDATGIGEHHVGTVHDGAEGAVFEGLGDHDVGASGHGGQEGVAHEGVAVGGQDEVHVRVGVGQAGDGAADPLHRLSPGLAAVGGDQDHATGGCAGRSGRGGGAGRGQEGGQALVVGHDRVLDGLEEGVDDGVAGDADGGRVHVLAQEVVSADRRGAQVQGGDLTDEAAVGLLGEGGHDVTCTQAGLDVEDGELVVEGS